MARVLVLLLGFAMFSHCVYRLIIIPQLLNGHAELEIWGSYFIGIDALFVGLIYLAVSILFIIYGVIGVKRRLRI